jgi:uncharacterized protein (TIRG00374 family)
LATVLKFVVAIGLLTALIFYVDVEALRESILKANVLYLSLGSILVIVNIGLQFLRWRFLLRLIAGDIADSKILSSLFIGYSAGFFTPGQVGEHGGRMVSLSSLQSIQVLAVSLIDKIYILAVTIIVGVVGVWIYFELFLPHYWNSFFTVIVFAIVASFLIGVLYPDFLKKVLRLVLHKVRKYRAVSAFLFVKDVFHRRQARILLLLTFFFDAVVILQYHFFVLAFAPVSLGVSALCTSNILFIKAAVLPISLGDLGIRESTAIFFFTRAGVPAAAALNASLCVFFVNILLPSILGAILVLRLKTAVQGTVPR